MHQKILHILAGVVLAAVASVAQADYLFNLDVCQTFSSPQDNFEVCVKGKYTGQPVNVVHPPGWTLQPASYNAARNETCFSFVGPALPQQSPNSWPYHFGVNIPGAPYHLPVSSVYWTQGPQPSSKPGTSCGVISAPDADGTLTFLVSNDTDSEVVLDDVRWQTFSEVQALETMDRGEMPADSLNPAPLAQGLTLTPGESTTFRVQAPPGTASAVCFVTVRFPADVLREPRLCPLGTSIWTQQILLQ